MKQFKFNERQRFSIRKFSIGAASVLLGSVFFAVNSVTEVQAMEASSNTVLANNADQDLGSVPTTQPTELSPSSMNPEEDKNNSESGTVVSPILDSNPKKQALAKLIEEIDGKFSAGAYDEKTEDSVNRLKAVLEEAKATVNSATTEGELTQAHSRLVTATTQLKTKPEEKKEAPAVDTTNGKATVGIKATNTEKAADTNSIANSGSRDERNGKALDNNNPFRTEAATTNDDPAANQTYTAPAENADLKTLADKLLELGATVENNTKLANEMNALGDSKQVEKGTVKEINEFGGWKAVDGGVFAIARRTEEGVYPLETINSTLNDTVWLREQAFDRDTEYTLLLSKSRTRANRNEEVFDSSKYQPTGVGAGITKNVARYKGIEKTFTAYSTAEGSDIIVKFKPGYVGDSDGSKANYKVQVYSITGNQESLVYEATFDPSINKNDTKYIVTKATDGTNAERIKISKASNSVTIDGGVDNTTRPGFIGKREAEKLMAQAKNLPNGKAGTFTSKPIALPQGADHYKVRISLADQNRTGMSYQAWDEKYSIPVTGADFSIAQDTTKVAKSLLQKVYDKLLETVDKDKRGKTPETQAAYQAQLDAIKEALIPGKYTSTKNYQELLKFALEKQKKLTVDKSALVTSKEDLGILVVADPTPGKTPETVKVYNDALNAAKAEVNKANTVIDDASATVDQVAQAVADVKAAKAELKAAEAKLVVAATEDQKTKLKNDSDALKEADKTGKTLKSIAEYEAKYETLKTALTAAKNQAKAVLDKTENAGKVEATYAQIEVDKIKAELDKAAALLKDKGNTAELEKAKNDLKTLTQETNVTAGKTKETSDKYEAAKTAAEEAVTAAEAVISDINSTTEDVANALAEVKAKKAALEAAKAALVEAATPEQKTTLATDAAALVPASKEGKTPESITAYEARLQELNGELTAAKQAAEAIAAKGENASKDAAIEAQAKVSAIKAKLADAAALLKDKANTSALETAKNELKQEAAEEVTAGKTPETVGTYNTAKQAADEAVKAAEAVLSNPNATQDAVNAALQTVTEKKAALAAAKKALVDKITQDQKDDLANAEENLKLADTTGKAKESVKAYNDEVAKLSDELAAAKQAAKDLLDKGDNAGELEAYRVQAKINKLKSKLAEAAKLLKDIDKSAAKKEVEDAAKKATDAIVANNDLTPEQKEAAKAKVAEEATKAIDAIDKATTEDDVTAASNAGKLGIEKEAAKAEIEAAKAAKEKAIDANDKLSDSEKQAAKEEAAKLADEAKKAIDAATDNAGVDGAKATGTAAVEAVNPVGKEKALDAIQKATEDKLAEIDRDDKLSDKEKDKAKAEVAKAAIDAVNAINEATNQAAVDAKQTEGTKAVSEVNPVGKDKAKAEIEKELAEKTKAIDTNTDLTPEQKADAKAKIAEEAKKAIDAINKATTTEEVASAKESGKLAIEKEAAKAEIEAAKAAKEKAIDANPDLTDEEKAEAKARVEEEAEAAKNAIDKATELSDIDKVTETGKEDIKKVTVTSAKEEAKKAIDKALEEKEKAIDARTDLTQEEKEAAKKAAREEAEAAKNAIDKATTLEDINKVLEDGKENIAKINPENLKDKAKKAIDEALAAKEKAIDARTDLLPEEKEAAKKAAREEAEAAKNAIDKATTSEDINKVLEDGKENIANINPVGAKEEAKKAVEEALANKEKEIDESTDLTSEEKVKAKELAREEAKAAKDAIDKATSIEAIEKALRPFLYQIDQDALVFDRPELDIKAALQASITGTVIAERGNVITQAEIIAKLNLPEDITVISIDLPDTTTLGRKFAKVTLRLADGTQATVSVPVEVVEKSEGNHQQNNTQVKPQEVSKPAAEPSKNSEQVEDGKDTPSKAFEEKNSSKQTVLPNTGTTESVVAMIAAAASGLLGLGLAGRRRKDNEEA